MSLKVQLIHDFASVEAIMEQWQLLLEQQEIQSVALTPEWILSWWKAHNSYEDLQTWFIAVFENDRLCALFPFYKYRGKYRGIPVNIVSLPVDGITPHGDFIIHSKKRDIALQALLRELEIRKHAWDIVVLDRFRDNANRSSFFKQLSRCATRHGVQASLKTPIIKADGPWELFWSARPKKFRRSMQNKLNRIKRSNAVSIRKIESPDELLQALNTIYAISSGSWKGAVKRSLKDNPIEYTFYETFTRIAGEESWIQVWFLNYLSKPIAYEYHVVYDGVIYPLRADYDAAYKSLSPGSVLEYNIVKNLFENDRNHTYYSCANDYDYLLNWTTELEYLKRIELFNDRPISKLLFNLEYRIIPFLRRFKILRRIKDEITKRTRSVS